MKRLRVLAVLAVLLAAPAAAAEVVEVPLPEGYEQPLAVAVAPDGAVWTSLDGSWALARQDPDTHAWTKYDLATTKQPQGDGLYALVVAPDGVAWTMSGTHLHSVDPTTGDVRAHELPEPTQIPGGVHVDEDGRVWAALVTSDAVARFDPATGTMQSFDAPGRQFGPLEFTRTDTGATYLSATYANTYARLDPETGEVVPGPAGLVQAPTGIVHDGAHLWLGEHGGNSLVRIDPATDEAVRFPTAPSPYYPITGPSGIVVHPDGSLWFAIHFADRIARYDPAAGTMVEYEVPSAPGTNMQRVALDHEGRVWFGEWSRHQVAYATYGGETPDFETPGNVTVPPTGAVRVPFALAGDFRVGVGHPSVNATIEEGELIIRTLEADLGAHNVLLSKVVGKTYVGQHFTVYVQPEAESPAPALPALAAALVLALVVARRRAP